MSYGDKKTFNIKIDKNNVKGELPELLAGACMEDVNHELYGGIWSQMIFGEHFAEPAPEDNPDAGYGRTWGLESSSNCEFCAKLTDETTYFGCQTQYLSVKSADSYVILSNYGLNRQGMYFKGSREYEGFLVAKSESGAKIIVRAESRDGSMVYSESSFEIKGDFKRYDFRLVPDRTDKNGRFSILLDGVGEVYLGYAFLEPGEWGRYKGLHVRADVAKEIKNAGIKVLRFGGCMANAADWKWKKMIGKVEERTPYKGWWYGYSSYGFGIIEFMDLCEALGVEYVPDFNGWETPEDMSDFARFAFGTDPSDEWVMRRIEMGRKEPYNLKYIQIGNEEVIDHKYADNFVRIAEKIHSVNHDVTLVVGDFDYKEEIEDPYNFKGGHVSTLENHKYILDYCKSIGQKVMIDIHWWSEKGKDPCIFVKAALSLDSILKKICPDSDFRLCVFELNANRHDMERAMCNAYAVNAARKYGIFPIISSANALQVDGQNDNGWDQGLVFMNNNVTWLQPPALVAKLAAMSHEKYILGIDDDVSDDDFAVSASINEEKNRVKLFVLNRNDSEVVCTLDCDENVKIIKYEVHAEKSAVNTADDKERIAVRGPFELNCRTLIVPENSVSVFELK